MRSLILRAVAAIVLLAFSTSTAVMAQVPSVPPSAPKQTSDSDWTTPPPYSRPPGWTPGGAPTPGANASAEGGPGGVLVEVRTDDARTRIDRVLTGQSIPVCLAPCRKVLDRNSIYVIEGDGIRPSSQFLLPDDRTELTLDVRAGSTGRMLGGGLLIAGGLSVGYVGLLYWATGSVVNATSGNLTGQDGSHTKNSGLAMMSIGIPLAVVGLYLALTSQTKVVSSTGASF